MEFGYKQFVVLAFQFTVVFAVVYVPTFSISFLLFRKKENIGKIALLAAVFAFVLAAIAISFLLYRISSIYRELNI